MKIAGFEKFSLVDYDENITCTIFLLGCNFACPFCHNSSLVNNSAPCIDKEEVMDYLKLRKNVVSAVCISGGEPTLNNDLIDFIKEIKELGYKVKLDTNGTNFKMLKKLIDEKLIDYVAMDIKSSLDKYNIVTNKNIDFSNIKSSIDLLLSNVVDYEFRTTLVNEFIDDNDINNISTLIKGAKKYFLQKFVDSDTCILKGLHEVSKEKALQYKELLLKNINVVELRGY